MHSVEIMFPILNHTFNFLFSWLMVRGMILSHSGGQWPQLLVSRAIKGVNTYKT